MSPYGKNLLGLLAMTLIAGALGLYAFYGVKETDERAARNKDDEARLFVAHDVGERLPDGGVPQTEFTQLTVEAKGDRTELVRQADGGWELTAPFRTAADTAAVESLISSLQSTKTKATVEEQPSEEDLKKYGFSPPSLKISATANRPDGGVTTLTLEGGIENTFDGTMYVRRSTSPAVHQVEGGTKWALEKGTYDLREKSLVSLDEETLASLTLRTPKHTISLARSPEGTWQLQNAKDKPGPVDVSELKAFLRAVSDTKATSFPSDTPAERQRLGLQNPDYVLEAMRKEGGRVLLKVATPKEDAGTNVGALKEEGTSSAPVLAELPSSVTSTFEKTPGDFEDKTVLQFTQEAVARIRIQTAAEPIIELEKGPPADGGSESWTMVAPQKSTAKPFQVSSLLWTLSSLKGAERIERAPGSHKSLGLAPPSRRVELLDDQGKTLAVLAIGGKVAGKADRIWVKSGENPLFQVEESRLDALPSSVAELAESPESMSGADAGTTTAAPSH